MIHGAESYLLKTLKIPERLFNAALACTVVYLASYLTQKQAYDPVRQFTYIVATRVDHPAKDLKEFVAWAKLPAQAGKVNFASGGAGTSTHLNGELLNAAMESVGFQGLVGPANMPKEVVECLSNELAKALASPEIKTKFSATGAEVHSSNSAEFAAFVKSENEKWAMLIRQRKLQLD